MIDKLQFILYRSLRPKIIIYWCYYYSWQSTKPSQDYYYYWQRIIIVTDNQPSLAKTMNQDQNYYYYWQSTEPSQEHYYWQSTDYSIIIIDVIIIHHWAEPRVLLLTIHRAELSWAEPSQDKKYHYYWQSTEPSQIIITF